MDAHALLTSQGWRGKGHSLHKTNDGIGLAKPLLLSRKADTKGLGAAQHFTSNQWWMNAFDEQLKGLDTSRDGKVVQTVTTVKINSLAKAALGKYRLDSSFVRGGLLQGTIAELQQGDASPSAGSDVGPRPGAQKARPREESREERRARREAKRARKEERERRRLRKEARRERREAREEKRVLREARRARKLERAKDRDLRRSKTVSLDTSGDDADEERRHRRAKMQDRRRKKQGKEAKLSKKRDR